MQTSTMPFSEAIPRILRGIHCLVRAELLCCYSIGTLTALVLQADITVVPDFTDNRYPNLVCKRGVMAALRYQDTDKPKVCPSLH